MQKDVNTPRRASRCLAGISPPPEESLPVEIQTMSDKTPPPYVGIPISCTHREAQPFKASRDENSIVPKADRDKNSIATKINPNPTKTTTQSLLNVPSPDAGEHK
eukprot:11731884-Ditylum_brightwellii.AAC.1